MLTIKTAEQIATARKLINDAFDHIEALRAMANTPAVDDMLYWFPKSGFCVRMEDGKRKACGVRWADASMPEGLSMQNGSGERAVRARRGEIIETEIKGQFEFIATLTKAMSEG